MRVERISDDKCIFPYIAYISDDISDNPSLIIQLHGAGERGEGGDELDKVLVHGFANIMPCEDFHDCVLIMPQCPGNSFWAARVESIKKFVDKMLEVYNADKNRIYLTGISMGGFGTWYTAMAYPDIFAAIAPCCGGGMPWNAGVLTMPVWAFHGGCDDVVLPSNSIDMVESLRKTNNNVKFDLYEGVKHDSWNRAYSPELMKWLLEQRK